MSSRSHLRISSASRVPHVFPTPGSLTSGHGMSDRSEADQSSITHHEIRPRAFARPRAESSSLVGSYSSMNHKTPARSYYQKTYHATHALPESPQHPPQEVREDTAELASRAVSDAGEAASEQAAALQEALASGLPGDGSSETSSTSSRSPRTSVLTEMIRNLPDQGEEAVRDDVSSASEDQFGPVIVGQAIISQPHEGTPLIGKRNDERPGLSSYAYPWDLESLLVRPGKKISGFPDWVRSSLHRTSTLAHKATDPTIWNRQSIWQHLIARPASCLPAITLGLLLNILDALSYGMILFPLGQPIFAELGPDGISMFYISCIVSQLVYSMGGSIFKGGIGSEMIEVVPFFHKMAFMIMTEIGEDNPRSVLATTVLSYSISSVLTGLVFFLMGKCKLGVLIGFFPRHILLGCIGGVGFFLVVTGVEVSARLGDNLDYTLATLQKLVEKDTVPLWTVPLALALLLFLIKRWIKHSLTDACFFLSVFLVFYVLVLAIPDLNMETLRSAGWVFDAPPAGVPWYHFYSLYDFAAVDWKALASTVPAMLALTFFGILHVPINIPALAYTLGEDSVNVDRELKAHGYSNALSGLCGSIQNYLVYTNTVLFVRSGGDSRFAGVLLAIATFGVLIVGPVLIGFIPIMVVGALIFYLGFDLLREALVDTVGRVSKLEYLTIVIIVLTMGIYDFVVGILVGIVLACAAFVLQTSQVSAIRGRLPGGMASSMVRRHPTQRRFLQDVGSQTYVMKLAGFLFFGTIVGVENSIKTLLRDDSFSSRPIRFLVLDLSKVDGVDFSSAEAFARINRLVCARDVEMIMCGFSSNSSVGKALYNVGLLDGPDRVQSYEDLNSALESCENELLKAFYHERDILDETSNATSKAITVPQPRSTSLLDETHFNSPRRGHLHRVATTTLREQESSDKHQRWRKYEQPLNLILQTFADFSVKDDDFWSRSAPFFERREFPAGKMLYKTGDVPDAFYIVETGMLKAIYQLPQGNFSEVIVAGATCGELPFFSGTTRTSMTIADRDSKAWALTAEAWERLQKKHADVAQELLKISLILTSERMNAITKYMLLTGT